MSIRIHLRVRPTKKAFKTFDCFKRDDDDAPKVQRRHLAKWEVPTDLGKDYINNSLTQHSFAFDSIIPMKSTQDEAFNTIGAGCVSNALDGYNSTVFAYGQTGSGKTFTITGGAERYADRGLIPRSISMMFSEFRKRTECQWAVHVSYLEIYNETGYDLLDPSHETKSLEDLPKVNMMEDEGGNFHLKNLSMHRCESEEDALNQLFLGDTNRAISETAMNQTSSRSHCIFTLYIEGRKVGSDSVLRSKLHLVDLAGSERTHKTKASGQTLREAQHINQSLFFLEMVIVALAEKNSKKGRTHIPYRNSMMTSVLRDSLGGNCKTVMVATISAEREQLEESLSTCRFSQRVAMVKNDATINEETDPALIIVRLKSQVASLKAEMSFLKGESGEGVPLTDEERVDLARACRLYVDDPDPVSELRVGDLTLLKIKDCFAVLKNLVLDAREKGGGGGGGGGGDGEGGASAAELEQAHAVIKERDNEIKILVNMVKTGKALGRKPAPADGFGASPAPPLLSSPAAAYPEKRRDAPGAAATPEAKGGGDDAAWQQQRAAALAPAPAPAKPAPRPRGGALEGVEYDCEPGLADDPQEAFAHFKRKYKRAAGIDENKKVLKDKYDLAKAAGGRVNAARQTINYLKQSIEQIRRERAMEGLLGEDGGEDDDGSGGGEEDSHRQAIEHEKTAYKQSFSELRELKSEIEHIQRLVEKSRTKMQADFDQWYSVVLQRSERRPAQPAPAAQARAEAKPASPRRDAWGTPAASPTGPPPPVRPAAEAKGGDGGRPRPPLTGNTQADADIVAFYEAREQLLARQAKK